MLLSIQKMVMYLGIIQAKKNQAVVKQNFSLWTFKQVLFYERVHGVLCAHIGGIFHSFMHNFVHEVVAKIWKVKFTL